jgi:hypothetical protein
MMLPAIFFASLLALLAVAILLLQVSRRLANPDPRCWPPPVSGWR